MQMAPDFEVQVLRQLIDQINIDLADMYAEVGAMREELTRAGLLTRRRTRPRPSATSIRVTGPRTAPPVGPVPEETDDPFAD